MPPLSLRRGPLAIGQEFAFDWQSQIVHSGWLRYNAPGGFSERRHSSPADTGLEPAVRRQAPGFSIGRFPEGPPEDQQPP